MDATAIVAIVVASLLVLVVVVWSVWRVARRSLRLAARAASRLTDAEGTPSLELDGRLLPAVLLDPVRTVTSVAEVLRPQLLPTLAPDGTITLVFTDLEGSTALNVDLGDAAFAALLADHERLGRRLAREHRGRLVKSAGDGLMLAFKRPHDAVAFAVAFQRALADLAPVEVVARVGVHTGEVVSQRGDYLGANVALAARVSAAARGGQVLVSEPVRARVDPDRLGVRYGRARGHRLAGLPGRHRLHPVVWDA